MKKISIKQFFNIHVRRKNWNPPKNDYDVDF